MWTSERRTRAFGDTAGRGAGSERTLCGGNVRHTGAVAVVGGFLLRPTTPPIYMADQVGQGIERLACEPDQVVGIVFDTVMAVEAFKGFSYAWSTGCSAPCP